MNQVSEILNKQLPTKAEIKRLFKKFKLDLGFPINAPDGSTITDWSLWYKQKSYTNSDMRKFHKLMENNAEYELKPSSIGGSISIYKII